MARFQASQRTGFSAAEFSPFLPPMPRCRTVEAYHQKARQASLSPSMVI